MKAHVVLAHPETKSVNARLARASEAKLKADDWRLTFSDLYADKFDPREDPIHYEHLSDNERFNLHTEQRFNAENNPTLAKAEYTLGLNRASLRKD